jgi:hypothetical protein
MWENKRTSMWWIWWVSSGKRNTDQEQDNTEEQESE